MNAKLIILSQFALQTRKTNIIFLKKCKLQNQSSIINLRPIIIMHRGDCPICLESYNEVNKISEIFCANGHGTCKECLNTIIMQRLPRKCPECRNTLIIPNQRAREALHIEMTSIWRHRRSQSIQNQRQVPILLLNYSEREPYQNALIAIQPYTGRITCSSIVIVGFFLSFFQWIVIVINLVFFLSIKNYFSLSILYILVVQLFHCLKCNFINPTGNPLRNLVHQVLFFMYREERLFSSLASFIFYFSNLGIACIVYVMVYQLNYNHILAIPALVLNIGQFFISVVFSRYVDRVLEVFGDSGKMKCILLGILSPLSILGLFAKTLALMFAFWLILVINFGVIVFVVVRQLCNQRINCTRSCLQLQCYAGTTLTHIEFRQLYQFNKILTYLLMLQQFLLVPIALGFVIIVKCSQNMFCWNVQVGLVGQTAFAVSVFSPVIYSLTELSHLQELASG